MRRLIAISIVLTLGLAAWGQGVQERCTRHTMKFQGFEREYYLYTPQGLKEKAPLVMVLHGYGGSALKGRKEMMDVADRYGLAVCYPQGEKDPSGKTGWNVGYPKQEGMKTDDVKFICALAKKVCRENGLDSGNTFLTGMSNGGEMCYFTAMRKPKAFKAIASIAGLTMEWIAREYSYSHPVPFMEVHGTEDRVSEWTGDPEDQGGWGAYMAVPAALSHIIAANGCVSETITNLPRKEGRNQVILYHFQGGEADVLVYKVIGGDHSWLDEDMGTCDAVLEFFKKHL
jgi:polyhydroxybutyrate depolymerase